MEQSKLIRLMEILESKKQENLTYTVPDLWNVWDYQGKERIKSPNGHLKVNPYSFFYEVVRSFILPHKQDNIDYSKPVHLIKNNPENIGGDWIKKSVVYSMMIRTSTAWDHNANGSLDDHETGTFVKTLALLPLLKKMGVDVVYMLPISTFSLKDKKGELGSPYGVKNFFKLDPHLKETLVGDELTVEEEFQAFVEACHILDMKVMIDIIPRTNAIENDLIIEHPDWFYWIRSEEFANYYPPHVPTLGNVVNPTPEHIEAIYQSEDVWKHIRKFAYNPKTIDPIKYQQLVEEYKNDPTLPFSDLVKREFHIQVAPAFSDQINDPQPPWSDITFFRMYEDHPVLSQKEISKRLKPNEELPPYILFDTIKNNFYQGNQPNTKLWETLSGVIPYYQTNFGIDGARIDMGHALSSDLLHLIISKARAIDPYFSFIAEELYAGNAEKAKSLGYNMIIGDGFWHEPRYEERTKPWILNAAKLKAPVFACGETHDTPRLAAREGGRTLARMLTILNMFVPNGVPFINSGQEVYEVQPMNTGLDARPNEQYQLDPKDPFYGKLALFDKYAIHYLNENRFELANLLEQVAAIRKEYLASLTNLEHYQPIQFEEEVNCIGLAYKNNTGFLLLVANLDPFNPVKCNALLNDLVPKVTQLTKLFSISHHVNVNFNHTIVTLEMHPGEVVLLNCNEVK